MKIMIKLHHPIIITSSTIPLIITKIAIIAIKFHDRIIIRTKTIIPIAANLPVAIEEEAVLVSRIMVKGVGHVAAACTKITITIVDNDPIITEDHGNKITIMGLNDKYLIIIN